MSRRGRPCYGATLSRRPAAITCPRGADLSGGGSDADAGDRRFEKESSGDPGALRPGPAPWARRPSAEEGALREDQTVAPDSPQPGGRDALSGDDAQALAGGGPVARRGPPGTSPDRRSADVAVPAAAAGSGVRRRHRGAAADGRGAPPPGAVGPLWGDPAGAQAPYAGEAGRPDPRPHRPPEPRGLSAVVTGVSQEQFARIFICAALWGTSARAIPSGSCWTPSSGWSTAGTIPRASSSSTAMACSMKRPPETSPRSRRR